MYVVVTIISHKAKLITNQHFETLRTQPILCASLTKALTFRENEPNAAAAEPLGVQDVWKLSLGLPLSKFLQWFSKGNIIALQVVYKRKMPMQS